MKCFLTLQLIIFLQKPTLITLLNEWRLFCEKPPKGFEKYFKPGSKQPAKDAKAKEAKDGKEIKTETPKPPPVSSSGGPSKSYDQWSFGLFGGTGSRYHGH